MKKKSYIGLTLILSLLCATKTYAACTQEEKDKFTEVKSQYKITTEFNINNKTYSLIAEREYPDMYDYKFEVIELTDTYDPKNEIKCLNPDDKITTCINFPSGSYKVQIVGQTSTCNEVLEETVIELAKYNEYYEDPLCEGIEEFYLCQPTYDKEIDYETFVSRVNTYKKTKQKKLDKLNEQSQQDSKILNKIVEYIKENLIQIIIVIIFIILIIASSIVAFNSAKKSRRLE